MDNWYERTRLLVGSENIERLRSSLVVVVGLGGVGAYAAEMCARAGVGNMLIADCDIISPTNLNRQLLALNSTMGMKKTELMRRRVLDINPDINISVIDQFLDPENICTLLSQFKADYIVDAIDTLSPKIALIKYAVENGIPLVSSMGAGAKYDVTSVKIADISKSFNCPLAYMLRKRLRKEGISKGFKVVFSQELPDPQAIIAVEERNKKSVVGTISYIPAVFGCACAQVVLESIVKVK